jgi:predicted nucleotidyltransferase
VNLSSPIESLVPGLRGRVLTALVRSPRPLSVREVARKARSNSHSSVKLTLVSLIDEGMARYAIVSKGAHYVELNSSHLLVQHLVAIDHAKDSAVDAIRDEVASWQRAPRSVVLFGSVARCEDTSASDIDLLVVWRGERAPSDDWDSAKLRLVERVYEFTGNSTNIIEFSSSDWEAALTRREPLIASIARDGQPVSGTTLRTLTQPTRKAASR